MDFTQSFTGSREPQPVTSHHATGSAPILDKIIASGLRLTVLLVPLFFLPWTVEIFELNKQFLLLGLTVLMFVLWVAKVVFSKNAILKGSWLNWLVLAWLVVVVVATFFSIDPITSVLGFYGRFNGGLVSVVAYVLLFFLVVNNVNNQADLKNLLGWWLTSLGIGSGLLILGLVGINLFNFIALPDTGLALFGNSLNGAVLVLAASLPIALWFARAGEGNMARAGSLLLVGLIALTLLLVDYQLGWLGLTVGLVFWLIMVFIKNESVGFKWTTLPSLLLLIGILAWPVAITRFTQVATPVEVNLSTKASWQIALQNATTSPILGSGPETFIFGFSKFKPDNFNDSDFWAFRFDKAGSEFAQVLSTTGFVGLVVYGLIFLLALYLGWRMLKDTKAENWYLKAAVLASWLVLFAGQIFYFVNTNLAIAWWLMLGLLTMLSGARQRAVSLATSPRASFIFSFGLALVILVSLGVFYGMGRLWTADVIFAQARQNSATVDTLDLAMAQAAKAVALNPWRDVYHIGYAQVLLAQANRVARQPAGATDPEKQQQIQNLQNYISRSIAEARAATELGPENVANWEALGSIYRGTVLFARDAENWVIDSFNQAIKKEPSNPALYTELGKAYLISASRKIQEAQQNQANQVKLRAEAGAQIAVAMEQFDKAVELKANYTPAHFNQALAFELQGKVDEAIDKLQRIREFNPQDIDVLFELGSLYNSKNDNDKAIAAFTIITSLVPNHANTHFSLALIYEKTGQIDKAITELEMVLKTNPNNQQVVDKLNSLKNNQDKENTE